METQRRRDETVIREEKVTAVPQGNNVTSQANHPHKRAVGVYKRQEDIEAVIRALKNADYDMNRVSLIARHIEDIEGAEEVTETTGNEAAEGAAAGATTGTVLGGVGGFLVGVGLLAIPGIGPILAAGVEIAALGSTAAGAGIGALTGGIIGGLVGLGIPEERAKVYNQRVKAGDHLLMVSGRNDSDLERAISIMRNYNAEEFGIYDAPDLVDSSQQQTQVRPQHQQMEVERTEVEVHRTEPVETRPTAVTKTESIDIDRDPEVVIVDKRRENRNNV